MPELTIGIHPVEEEVKSNSRWFDSEGKLSVEGSDAVIGEWSRGSPPACSCGGTAFGLKDRLLGIPHLGNVINPIAHFAVVVCKRCSRSTFLDISFLSR